MPSQRSTRASCALCLLLSSMFPNHMLGAEGEVYRPPRLEDGHVDLQGTWSLENITSLERPPQFKTLVISATEAGVRNAARVAALQERLRASDEFMDTLVVEPIRGKLHSSVIV